MATRSKTRTQAPEPSIDGRPLRLFKVVGTVVFCTLDENGDPDQEYQAGGIVLYRRHLPNENDPVIDFERLAREIQEANETQRDALDRRVEELRARAAGAEPASE